MQNAGVAPYVLQVLCPLRLGLRESSSGHWALRLRGTRGTKSAITGSRAKSAANGYYISPQLYVTPEPTLIVPTGGISSSSPTYVVNYKRRGLPRPPPPFPFKESETKTENPNSVVPEEEVFSEGVRSIENRDCNENSAGKECLEVAIEDDLDGSFFDPRELMSTMSGSDTEDAGGGFRRCGSG